MKNIIGLVVVLGCLAACKQETGFKITADIAGMPDGLKVYLEKGQQILDSTVSKQGSFTFRGKTGAPFLADISVKTPDDGLFSGRSFDLFLENSEIHIKSQWEDFYKMEITGSALQDEYTVYTKQLEPLYQKLNVELAEQAWNVYNGYLYENKFTADCIPPGIKIARQQAVLTEEVQKISIDFIKEHPASLVSLKIFGSLLMNESHFTRAELAGLAEGLSADLKQTEAYRELEECIAAYGEKAKGEKFIDFRVVDMNGKEGMFSDYVQAGKYNMLEVWASWCGHCRTEIPHLKIVQEKYGDRFNIIAVSWDKSDAEWRKAMDEDKPGYLQLRVVKDDKGKDIGDYYHLSGIPYSLIIDGQGRIVSGEGRGVKLDLLLEELYGE